jgi:UDP-2,3-diacylglucosamine hydrolase
MGNLLELSLEKGKKAYFASDFHLGAPSHEASLKREKKLVRWLDHISPDCQYLFLLGDVFDFWFDYHDVVPKGFVRLLGKLAHMHDAGTRIFIFTGNHDMWMFGYLQKEIGAGIFRSPLDIQWSGYSMLVGHGDGLGPGDRMYKILKSIFSNPVCQRLFAFVHPRIGMGIAKAWSAHSRISSHKDDAFLGEKEFLWSYCKGAEKIRHRDLYLFGHRHLPLDLEVAPNSRYINLGEWLRHFHYLEFDGMQVELKTWEPEIL